jgi:hypothetical protein
VPPPLEAPPLDPPPDVLAAVDSVNWLEALAEGAVGAPRIKTAALEPPTAGTDYLICRLQEAEVTHGGSVYVPVNEHRFFSASSHLGVTCLVTGTITAYLEHRRIGGVDFVRVLKNGALVQEWSTTATTFQVRQVSVSVDVGDVIIFQHRGGDDVGPTFIWRRLRIYSNNPDFAVA